MEEHRRRMMDASAPWNVDLQSRQLWKVYAVSRTWSIRYARAWVIRHSNLQERTTSNGTSWRSRTYLMDWDGFRRSTDWQTWSPKCHAYWPSSHVETTSGCACRWLGVTREFSAQDAPICGRDIHARDIPDVMPRVRPCDLRAMNGP